LHQGSTIAWRTLLGASDHPFAQSER